MTGAAETLAEVAKHVAVLRAMRPTPLYAATTEALNQEFAIAALIGLVPEPVPEWPDVVVNALMQSHGTSFTASDRASDEWAKKYLTAMYRAGLDVRMRET